MSTYCSILSPIAKMARVVVPRNFNPQGSTTENWSCVFEQIQGGACDPRRSYLDWQQKISLRTDYGLVRGPLQSFKWPLLVILLSRSPNVRRQKEGDNPRTSRSRVPCILHKKCLKYSNT
eukprot:scaffold2167_cov363-Pavlova_lutheri.AAC.4